MGKNIFLLAFLVMNLSAAFAAKNMTDPLLGLTFHADEIRFQEASRNVKCGERGRVWVFSKIQMDGKIYAITAKLVPIEGDVRKGYQPTSGVVVEVEARSGTCKKIASPDLVFDPRESLISNEIQMKLIVDARSRYISAFGSQKQFSDEVVRQKVDASALPKIVSEGFGIK